MHRFGNLTRRAFLPTLLAFAVLMVFHTHRADAQDASTRTERPADDAHREAKNNGASSETLHNGGSAASTNIPDASTHDETAVVEEPDSASSTTSPENNAQEINAIRTPEPVFPTFRLTESLPTENAIRRRYTRMINQDTNIRRRQRSHLVEDRIREDIDIEIRFHQFPDDPSRMDVVVRSAHSSSNYHGDPLGLSVPANGLSLHCWQEEFEILCRDALSRREIKWPAWALLDFGPLLTSASVQYGTRWRRTIPNAVSAGWPESNSKDVRASLEIQRQEPDAPHPTITIEGIFETESELIVYGEPRRFPASAHIEIDFNHTTNLVERLSTQWRGELQFESTHHKEPSRWERTNHSRVIIRSEVL